MQKGGPIMAGLTGKRDGHYTARMNDELKANLLFLWAAHSLSVPQC
jgi:hypothetical protein